MRSQVEKTIRAWVTNEPASERELRAALQDWGLLGDPATVLEAWQMWKISDYHILPFAGGWFDQPEWVRQGFTVLNRLEAFHQLQAEKPDVPTTALFGSKRKH